MNKNQSRAHRRCRGERGASAVFLALLLPVLLGFAALLVDLGQVRASSRQEQLSVDLAALAGGKQLSEGDAVAACRDEITYLNENDTRVSPAINPVTFCAAISNHCSNTSAEASPSITAGDTTVSIHYPVPAAEIRDANWTSAGLNDGTSQCQRMRVLVRAKDAAMFSRIFGISSSTSARSATMRPTGTTGSPPALWLLDPTGCTSLTVNGGSQVTVGTSAVQGVVTVDSNGTTCTGGNTTVSVSGAGSTLHAVGPPSGDTSAGQINLNALPAGSTTCALPACNVSEVSGGLLAPQPQHGDPASREYIDWRWNCKTGYPAYHGVTINDCPNSSLRGGTSYPYIDNLKTAVGASGTPSTGSWTKIGPGNSACSPSASITYPVGNYYVACTRGNNGFTVNGGVTINFLGGNVVFDDNVTVSTGGVLQFNTANTNSALSTSCTPPSVQTPCIGSSSTNAAFVFIRGDSSTALQTSGTGTVTANHTFVYGGTGSLSFSGAPPTWTAPTEGPFAGLAYWTDMPATATNAQLSSFTITGGSGANLAGVFFTPEAAPFKIAGGGNWGQQHAQFISYQLTVTGGGILTMAPDPTAVIPPTLKGYLIR
jgi:Flp pilus assembly protein TadG